MALLNHLLLAENEMRQRHSKLKSDWQRMENRLAALDLKIEQAHDIRNRYLLELEDRYPSWRLSLQSYKASPMHRTRSQPPSLKPRSLVEELATSQYWPEVHERSVKPAAAQNQQRPSRWTIYDTAPVPVGPDTKSSDHTFYETAPRHNQTQEATLVELNRLKHQLLLQTKQSIDQNHRNQENYSRPNDRIIDKSSEFRQDGRNEPQSGLQEIRLENQTGFNQNAQFVDNQQNQTIANQNHGRILSERPARQSNPNLDSKSNSVQIVHAPETPEIHLNYEEAPSTHLDGHQNQPENSQISNHPDFTNRKFQRNNQNDTQQINETAIREEPRILQTKHEQPQKVLEMPEIPATNAKEAASRPRGINFHLSSSEESNSDVSNRQNKSVAPARQDDQGQGYASLLSMLNPKTSANTKDSESESEDSIERRVANKTNNKQTNLPIKKESIDQIEDKLTASIDELNASQTSITPKQSISKSSTPTKPKTTEAEQFMAKMFPEKATKPEAKPQKKVDKSNERKSAASYFNDDEDDDFWD